MGSDTFNLNPLLYDKYPGTHTCFLFSSNKPSSIVGCNNLIISAEVLLKFDFYSIKSSNYVIVWPFDGEVKLVYGFVKDTIFRD